ncbi:hypothetical protein EKO04_005746 [Ascochyta lentis]|uniref:Carbohydrate-binding module family 18 protein n=1 Tax=Ascochyta lentis TaxID=205686 RepID=A0A8H7J5D2_9PLEO|nr:hypothetical protein EKO04_005746 [Ascochyta lentis]
MFAQLTSLSIAFALFTHGVNGAPGDIVCRYETTTLATVNYYTCTELALKYSITLEKFFELNPSVDKECATIKPNTNYCVAGWLQLPVAEDGLCGPQHNNTTCLGLDKQCCNGETWKCGDQIEDCQAGTCFSGACEGFPDQYSMDGKCGMQNNNLLCGGKWGACCDITGKCGTGESFCGVGRCQTGNCTITIPPPPSADVPSSASSTVIRPSSTPTPGSISPDGFCGGTNKFICKGSTFGDCCSSSGFCGSTTDHCQAGCQASFGACTNLSLSPDGTCGGANKYQFNHCAQGCQKSYSSACTTSNIPTLDGACGSSKGFTCAGGPFNGQCCSSGGFCGTTDGHCKTGCQKNFGTCK